MKIRKYFIFVFVLLFGMVTLVGCGENETPDNPGELPENPGGNLGDPISTEIDKYWNIDTKKFNASLFDGNFSFGEFKINGKLTGKTFKDNGYGLRIGSGLFDELLWDEDNNVYSDRSNGVYILKNDAEVFEHVYLNNYKNETDIYSDNTELYYSWSGVSDTYGEIIIPTCLLSGLNDVVYQTLSIENIVGKLGNPTYVQGRLSKNINEGQFFKYVYVYSDYTLWFEMIYYSTTGITVTGFIYEGNQTFSQPCQYYDAELNEVRTYNNSLEFLNEEQAKYESSK